MSRRAKILLVIDCLVMVCLVAGAFYQQEIRIAYHRNWILAAAESHDLLSFGLGNTRRRTPTVLEQVKFDLFKMTNFKESVAMRRHEEAWIKLGYLEKREFWFTNRICVNTDTNLCAELRPKVGKAFDAAHWYSYYFPETNKLQITALSQDMPKWEKLVLDFDQK